MASVMEFDKKYGMLSKKLNEKGVSDGASLKT